MKKFYMLLMCLMAYGTSHAVLHEVEVGGNQSITPYYDPALLTIDVGDSVRWTWVSGQHNVTSTSGPASFASGNHQTPHVFIFQFTVAGVYDYECTLFNHAATQFGTITVNAGSMSVEAQLAANVELSPNPMVNILRVSAPDFAMGARAQIYELGTGKLLVDEVKDSPKFELSVTALPAGSYLLLLNDEEKKVAKRVQKF
ncbi:MAG: hypothetical protein AAF570_29355 [Bacteroidota bacterium]